MLIGEIHNDNSDGSWFARVVVYTSPNGLLTHPDVEFINVIEVGRKKDLKWAHQQAKEFCGYE